MSAVADMATSGGMALTSGAIRLLVLMLHSFRHGEPVLLVGDTGLGKTSACAAIAKQLRRDLVSFSCHLGTDASDFLGSLRPARDKECEGEKRNKTLFEWQDGPLVRAMKNGHVFLVDEISLADDSVLERINSVLEDERMLALPEKPSDNDDGLTEIVAEENFLLCATMNPSGDFGKKELSPALRNRFSEIWCPADYTDEDSALLLAHALPKEMRQAVTNLAAVVSWLNEALSPHLAVTFRDIKALAEFYSTSAGSSVTPVGALIHGACLVVLDGLQAFDAFADARQRDEIKDAFVDFIRREHCQQEDEALSWVTSPSNLPEVKFDTSGQLKIGPFCLPRSDYSSENMEIEDDVRFNFESPTVAVNAMKIARAMTVNRPVLLEGPPGVGKSAIVAAMARAAGATLTRINLSEQTDVADLFGQDMPESQAAVGTFSWQDGPFLAALKAGRWILLDELNLASQQVLEGLNACLDHRGEVYIPELDRTFNLGYSSARSRVLATQNPHRDGGGRKGLPRSFLNRFVKVFVTPFNDRDVEQICAHRHPRLGRERVSALVAAFDLLKETLRSLPLSYSPAGGGPWELNLRDLIKWCSSVEVVIGRNDDHYERYVTSRTAELLFAERLRRKEDRQTVKKAIKGLEWGAPDYTPGLAVYSESVVVGSVTLQRGRRKEYGHYDQMLFLPEQLPLLESMAFCVHRKWIPILIGEHGTGKTSAVEILAMLAGRSLATLTMSSLSDTSDLLGGFEQSNTLLRLSKIGNSLLTMAENLPAEKEVNSSAFVDLIGRVRHDMQVAAKAQDTKGTRRCLLALVDKLRGRVLDAARLDKLAEEVKATSASGHGFTFEWVDSALVEAVEEGGWILVDQANLCPASVLDRLNGLFEENGVLVIGESGCGEDGRVRAVRPHPDFRIFLTADPKHGELSPAMR